MVILIADDDASIREELEAALDAEGWDGIGDVDTSTTEKALSAIDAYQPDVVVLDGRLADGPSFPVVEEINGRVHGKKPVFIIYSSDWGELKDDFARLGVVRGVKKINHEGVAAEIKSLV